MTTIFTDQPDVTEADRKRLSPHLRAWNHLNNILTLNPFTEDDFKKLILLEVEGKKRKIILEHLVGRLKSMERTKALLKINEAIILKRMEERQNAARKGY